MLHSCGQYHSKHDFVQEITMSVRESVAFYQWKNFLNRNGTSRDSILQTQTNELYIINLEV